MVIIQHRLQQENKHVILLLNVFLELILVQLEVLMKILIVVYQNVMVESILLVVVINVIKKFMVKVKIMIH